ncbi:MAG: hypothetical protein JWR14_5881 [Caballeronia sp.]|jgi:hypothetical protein|nr:hypothetical protein [Caballeronia sp.]
MNQGFGLRNDSVRDLEGRAYGEKGVVPRFEYLVLRIRTWRSSWRKVRLNR